MKANELRIGNYVLNLEGEVSQIKAIMNDGRIQHTGECGGSDLLCFADPIPLTEEWLLKFGFRKTNIGAFFKAAPFYIEFKDWVPCGYWMMRDIHVPIVLMEYVHQLQNLYFALTGEELIIKENKP